VSYEGNCETWIGFGASIGATGALETSSRPSNEYLFEEEVGFLLPTGLAGSSRPSSEYDIRKL